MARSTGNPRYTLRDTVMPFALPKAAAQPKRDSPVETAVVFSDTHFRYADEAALAVVYAVIADLQPDQVCHLGDVVDCAELSQKFRSDPLSKGSVQDEIDQARRMWAHICLIAPQARKRQWEGNHEARLGQLLWTAEGAHATLLALTDARKALTWPTLLGLPDMGVEWVGTSKQDDSWIVRGLRGRHGTAVAASAGASGLKELQMFNASGMSGHTHRFARTHYHGHTWWEIGHTQMEKPHYMKGQKPNWQQGFAVVTRDKRSGLVSVEGVAITKGRAHFRGTLYAP